MDIHRLDAWRATLDSHVESGAVPGLVGLVCHQGEIGVHVAGTLALGGTTPMARDTIFRIASMTKPVSATAAMILVERGQLKLDDPVDPFLPELANRRVLKRLDGPQEDTVPASRPISLRDLLTLRMGLGHIMARSDGFPIQEAINAVGVLQGFPQPQSPPEPDTWMAGVGTLPLMHQPGEQWKYDLGLDVLGVLIARAAGQPLDAFLQENIFGPLGMKDTGFFVPENQQHRLATCYSTDSESGELRVYDDTSDSQWGSPPRFPAAASGLVSTADDYLTFCQMLLHRGSVNGSSILSPASVELMTQDHLTPRQRASNHIFLGASSGWGFGMAVNITAGAIYERPGRFGWEGGFGTSARTDPSSDLIGILLTQRAMDSPETPKVFDDFWTALYAAVLGAN